MEKENALIPSTADLGVYQVIAKTASQSKLFEKMGGEAGLLSIMLMARELGLPPLQAVMGGMNIIQGKVELSPRLMNTMIRKAGHKLEIMESSDLICRIKGTRHDTKEEYMVSFSLDDAKKAGLVRSGGGWEKFASDMLFARCLSRLARRLFADVISTAYAEGEIDRDGWESTPKTQVEHVEDVIEVKPEPVPIPPVEIITSEEAQEIENMIRPDDKEYRANLLNFFSSDHKSKINDFYGLPRKYLKACLKSVSERGGTRKQAEDIPF